MLANDAVSWKGNEFYTIRAKSFSGVHQSNSTEVSVTPNPWNVDGSLFNSLLSNVFQSCKRNLMKRKVASNRERHQPATQPFVQEKTASMVPLRMSHHKHSLQQTCFLKCLPFTQIPPTVSPYISHLRTDLSKKNRKKIIITYIKDF